MSRLSRRKLLAYAGAATCAVVAGGAPAEGAPRTLPPAGLTLGLKDLAARKGLLFGGALTCEELALPRVADAFVFECDGLTPGYEMKWGVVEKTAGAPGFGAADGLIDFARGHGMSIHGHTLAWYRNLPSWLAALTVDEKRKAMEAWVDASVAHFRGRLASLDVLNEVVEPYHGRADGLRNSVWLEAMGETYPEAIFARVHAAAPDIQLYYNDYGFEYDVKWQARRRVAVLKFLELLKKAGAPVVGAGLQTHLFAAGYDFKPKVYRAFLRDVASLGLKIHISELDCRDTMLTGDIAARDLVVADMVRRVLDVALDERAVTRVTSWGLMDRMSWLNSDPSKKRTDGQEARPLPYDDSMQPKPVRAAIAAALAAAPAR